MKRVQLLMLALLIGAWVGTAQDARLGALKDLDGYFPFNPPASLERWQERREFVKRQILVATGLWPMPSKTPLNVKVTGKIDCGEYSVEKVYFESAPGFYVTGNLYRPNKINGKVPGVLFAHGHWKDARLSLDTPEKARKLIADGAERFEQGGRQVFQSLCVQLARMGCVVWQWDMLSDSDAVQFSAEIVHRFKQQRTEMNTTQGWGLYSPQAEAHLQSILGLQTLNAVRGVDFLLSLPEVDPERLAMTGASGGGTQTMLLAAIDERLKLSFPVVMVSTAMQGGCTCENSSLLRVNTGNIEFAALFAPKPQGMNTANDWTKELATKGFPELRQLYTMYGAQDNVYLLRGEHFPHNYNAVTRSAFYTFLNKHFKLGQPTPVIERDFTPLTREQLTVWGGDHPAPKSGDPEFERQLLKWLDSDAQRQLVARANTLEGLRESCGKALEVVIGRTYRDSGEVEWQKVSQEERPEWVEVVGNVHNKSFGELVKAECVIPKSWRGRTLLWLDDSGMGALRDAEKQLKPMVKELLKAGVAVVAADLFQHAVRETRVVENPREAPCYTYGYNHALFAQRVHDVLSVIRLAQSVESKDFTVSLSIAGWGECGAIAVAARALAGAAVERLAVDTGGLRFGEILNYRDPRFLPGGAKYLDLPGMIALNAPHRLWVVGEKSGFELYEKVYQQAQKAAALVVNRQPPAEPQAAALAWLTE